MVKSTKMHNERRIVLGRSRAYMLAGFAAVALIAGGGAANAQTIHGGPATPLSCQQQYTAWRAGPVRAAGQQVMTDLTALKSANSEDVSQLTYGLRRLSYDSSTLERYPMPTCADPAGYWAQSITYMGNSAAMYAQRPGSMPVISPAAFMQRVRNLRTRLSAELSRTVGLKG